ncbi:MAG: hypothetical protein EOM68_00370 [Spirochaetia bacterium]|nr:hypothetical protein [Spirochaetia bacterium]
MRRALLPALMVLCLSSLFATPSLVVISEGEGPAYTLMKAAVSRVAEQSLLCRIAGEGELTVTLSDLVEATPNALSASVLFSYGEKTLQLKLSSEGKDERNLSKHVERDLFSMLLYDGRVFLESEYSPIVDYTYGQGYATLAFLSKGDHYKGLDSQGDRFSTVVVQQSFGGEEPVSLLVGTSGKKLLPGMRLEKQAGKSVSFSVAPMFDASSQARVALEGMYAQEVGLYPFTLVVGGGFDLAGSSLSSLYGQVGLSLSLPLSMLFGIDFGLWRNSSLAVGCTLGLGYALADSALLYGSGAILTYRYQIAGMGIDVGVGSKHWASETKSHSSGLFMQLGLAYTW